MCIIFPHFQAFGGVFGTFAHGFITNKYGRKWPIISLTVPLAISWLLIAFAQNAIYLYVGRFIHGFICTGIFVICQFYFVEISDDR